MPTTGVIRFPARPTGGTINGVHLYDVVDQDELTTFARKASAQDDFFDAKTPPSLWLAGLIAADGCIARNRRRWSISQSGPEGLRRIQTVCDLLGYDGRISRTEPPRGATAHSISILSPPMTEALEPHYGIGPSKTLTYDWPQLMGDAAAAFLRGYVEGDGCVGVYSTPSGSPFLHISYVGTPRFVDGATSASPGKGRVRRLTRCKNLTEVRYSGRQAWAFGRWLYSDSGLPSSAKTEKYFDHISTVNPRWIRDQATRWQGLSMLSAGMTVVDVAAVTGVNWRTVYKWKAAS